MTLVEIFKNQPWIIFEQQNEDNEIKMSNV